MQTMKYTLHEDLVCLYKFHTFTSTLRCFFFFIIIKRLIWFYFENKLDANVALRSQAAQVHVLQPLSKSTLLGAL